MDNCPKCNASFIGDPIPEEMLEHYSGTHWRKDIMIDGDEMGIYDGCVAMRCHECSHEFPRGDSKVALIMFDKYKRLDTSK